MFEAGVIAYESICWQGPVIERPNFREDIERLLERASGCYAVVYGPSSVGKVSGCLDVNVVRAQDSRFFPIDICSPKYPSIDG